MELLIVVGILGILSAMRLVSAGNEWRRERVNAQATAFVGWLEAVRRASQRGNPCQVTFAASLAGGSASFAPGALVATAAEPVGTAVPIANNCLAFDPFRIQAISAGGDTFLVTTNAPALVFTPRGTLFNPTSAQNFAAPVLVSFALNGADLRRCVELSSALGLIRVGRNDTSSTGACTFQGRY